MSSSRVHCVVLPYPAQGHINPMLQFSKFLQHEGVKITLVTTHFYSKSVKSVPPSITLETISDGCDNGNMERFWEVIPKTFSELLEKLDHVDCIIYDSFFCWALDVAKKFGILGVVFFTQNMSVNSIYYHVHLGKLKPPLTQDEISLPFLPKLQLQDMPSFFFTYQENPGVLKMLAAQLSNIEKADWILCNSFYEMEKEVVDWAMEIWPKFRTIGPSIPSIFLDNNDEEYGVAQSKTNENEDYMKWLDDKPKQSVIYVSFGTMVELDEEKIQEIAWGLIDSEIYFLWVVRAAEETKLPKEFNQKSEKGLVVTWCSQLKVLAHEAIGCFVTHCGWNSTLEALSLGVPTIAIPQWSDQTTNAKFITDVWKTGIRVAVDEKHVVRRDALKHCILKIMKSEKEEEEEIKNNVMHWKTLATRALANEDGSSYKNIIEFVNSLFHQQARN